MTQGQLVGPSHSRVRLIDLLLALNAGLPGMCTIHANSAREALVKMCTLPLLAGARQGRGVQDLDSHGR